MSVFKILGASNHSKEQREENDFYATDPIALQLLLDAETFNKNIWECACGEKHLSNVLTERGYNVRSSDLINRCNNEVLDFLQTNDKWNGDIITNPPFKVAQEFVEKAIQVIPEGNKVAMLLRMQFLESRKRRKLFEEHPPTTVYVFSKRVNCAKNADFVKYPSSAMAYCWFVWEKGYKGETKIKWLN